MQNRQKDEGMEKKKRKDGYRTQTDVEKDNRNRWMQDRYTDRYTDGYMDGYR